MITKEEAEEYYNIQSRKNYKKFFGVVCVIVLLALIGSMFLEYFSEITGKILNPYRIIAAFVVVISGFSFLIRKDVIQNILEDIENLVNSTDLIKLNSQCHEDNELFVRARKEALELKLKENFSIKELIILIHQIEEEVEEEAEENKKSIIDKIKKQEGGSSFLVYEKIKDKGLYRNWMFEELDCSLLASDLVEIDNRIRCSSDKERDILLSCLKRSAKAMPLSQLLKFSLEVIYCKERLIEEMVRRVDSEETTLSEISERILIYYPNQENWKQIQNFVVKTFRKHLPREKNKAVFFDLLEKLPQGSMLRSLVLIRKKELN